MTVSRGFTRVADSLPVGILRADAGGRCSFMNRAAREILGLSAVEARGDGWLSRLSDADRRAVDRLLGTEAGDRDGHLVLLVDTTASALEVRKSAHEIEERLRASVRDLRDRLTHLTRVSTMGEMASSIAHEVSQPLTAIAMYAQACRRLMESGEAGPTDVQDVLQRIAREALRAGDIIHRLRDLVRRRETRWAEADLNALVRDVAPLAEVDARHHGVRLSFDLGPELPPILADGVQVQQVVLNLIRNGIDAVEDAPPERRQVRVRTGLDGPRSVCLTVEDQGDGVAPEAEEHIFQPFFTTKKAGIGMGLSISRSIASTHHGRIGFDRRAEGGSAFWLTLPTLDESGSGAAR